MNKRKVVSQDAVGAALFVSKLRWLSTAGNVIWVPDHAPIHMLDSEGRFKTDQMALSIGRAPGWRENDYVRSLKGRWTLKNSIREPLTPIVELHLYSFFNSSEDSFARWYAQFRNPQFREPVDFVTNCAGFLYMGLLMSGLISKAEAQGRFRSFVQSASSQESFYGFRPEDTSYFLVLGSVESVARKGDLVVVQSWEGSLGYCNDHIFAVDVDSEGKYWGLELGYQVESVENPFLPRVVSFDGLQNQYREKHVRFGHVAFKKEFF